MASFSLVQDLGGINFRAPCSKNIFIRGIKLLNISNIYLIGITATRLKLLRLTFIQNDVGTKLSIKYWIKGCYSS